jgi:hypothetical protein
MSEEVVIYQDAPDNCFACDKQPTLNYEKCNGDDDELGYDFRCEFVCEHCGYSSLSSIASSPDLADPTSWNELQRRMSKWLQRNIERAIANNFNQQKEE